MRQYSLFNHPQDRSAYRVAVLKDPNSRGGSVKLHETFAAGDRIRISAPRNLFPLDAENQHVLLFAGGIGITPLLSMAQVLHGLGRSFELHYHARSKSSSAFYEELRNSPFKSRVFFHFDDSSSDSSTEVAKALSQPGKNVHLYTCGPNGFMDYIFDAARKLGWAGENLHKEVFSAKPDETAAEDRPFELHLVRSGKTLQVPADKSALEVLEEAGVDVDSSCEQGICGACLTRVVDGTPDHRDQFMTDAEKQANDQFTPCCSRAQTATLSIEL
ncbi:ferredoxin:oxidoreductase FAD/NAD(P)-binding subunit [Marinobacterium nitratireducens]|uniref:Ferredoxin:oxidoreductase FAD/NAD(P)-binding subunit n=1 Tax=Marinobacterium nitratireducens TaxID=518897 RepID=A0A917Z8V9_9GAMM|nr:ferredoxin:oxidoreductase FAD/NAD(P)-binding subunit [Marinobacterium nitratireducens]